MCKYEVELYKYEANFYEFLNCVAVLFLFPSPVATLEIYKSIQLYFLSGRKAFDFSILSGNLLLFIYFER